MVNASIEVDHLTKQYGHETVVKDVSFRVSPGEVVSLLGRNGAGKTTTIEILEGLRVPSSGSVRVLGVDPARGGRRLRNRVGTVLQSAGIDANLSLREIVGLSAGFYRPRHSVEEVLAEVGLERSARVRVRRLSGGQCRRLDLALALSGNPMVLFLDEPTTGLDPTARHRAWESIVRLRDRGVAILLTSHYLEEVEQLASRVVVLHFGRVVADGTPALIRSGVRALTTIAFRLNGPVALPRGPWEVGPLMDGMTSLRTARPTEAVQVLAAWALANGFELDELEVLRPSLEQAYLNLTPDV